MNNKPFKHALIVSNYHQMFDDLKKNNIKFKGEPLEPDIAENIRNSKDSKINILEEDINYSLNIKNGEEFFNSYFSNKSIF